MRQMFLLFTVISISSTVWSQQPFFDSLSKSWEQVISNAKLKNKVIFVDVFTEWCGPCKWMDQNTFNNQKVITRLNQDFYSVKIDAEKSFGVDFIKTYKVNGYPTYLFFTPSGQLLQVNLGSMNAETFLNATTSALNRNKTGKTASYYQEQYLHKKNDITFLKEYIQFLHITQQNNKTVIEEYLQKIPKETLESADNFRYLMTNYVGDIDENSSFTKFMVDGYRKYPVKSYELMSAWNTIRSKLLNQIEIAGELQHLTLKNRVIQLNNLIEEYDFCKKREHDYLNILYAAFSKDSIQFQELSEEFIKRYTNSDTLNYYDRLQLKNMAAVRYHSTDTASLQNSADYKNFLKSFLFETRRTSDEINSIVFFYREHFPYSFNKEKNIIREWQQTSNQLYANNKIYVNPFLIENAKKNYSRLFE